MDENEDWSKEGIEKASHAVAEIFNVHHKKIVIPLLFAVIMGKKSGLPLFASVEILGMDRTRARLLEAMQFLGGISNKQMVVLQKGWKDKACVVLVNKAV
jgi:glutamyl-tRNA synthetase